MREKWWYYMIKNLFDNSYSILLLKQLYKDGCNSLNQREGEINIEI
jgi:hypothetical protein